MITVARMNSSTIKRFVTPFQRRGVFKGVFACNQLPNMFSLPALFIINLSPSSQPGSHWVSLYIDERGSAFYFDSFGMPPRNSDIIRFMRLHSKKSVYNRKQLQHLSSIKCGRFACVFVISILRGAGFKSIFDKFSNNLKINDIVIEGLYNYFDFIRKSLL